MRGVPFAGRVKAKVSAYADDINIFVPRRLDIQAVSRAVERYEEVAGAKINFDERRSVVGSLEGWRLPARALPLE